jgi:N-acylglucosamine 2-epimerase
MADFEQVNFWKEKFRQELFENVLPFWLKHSVDHERGGFFACLDENGEIYDRRKFMWLNGRQIWMFSRLAERYSTEDFVRLSNDKLTHHSRKEMIDSVCRAADFMYKHGVREDGMVYFSLAEDGQPYHFERKIFSACFLALGMASLGMLLQKESKSAASSAGHRHTTPTSAHGEDLVIKSLVMLNNIISWAHDPSPLNRPHCTGAPATSPLNVPMILLNLLDEFQHCGALDYAHASHLTNGNDYLAEEKWCIEEIIKHVRPREKIVLETVGTNGEVIPGYDGRHMNPGHAIEAGWFLLQYAKKHKKHDLIELATNMIDW